MQTLHWRLHYRTEMKTKAHWFWIFKKTFKFPVGWYLGCDSVNFSIEDIEYKCLRYMDWTELLKMFSDHGAKIIRVKFRKKVIFVGHRTHKIETNFYPYFETKEAAEGFFTALKFTEPNDYCNKYEGEWP